MINPQSVGRFSKIKILAAAFLLVFASQSANVAHAAVLGCGVFSSHCYSILRSTGTTFYGMYGTWNRAAMSAVGANSSNQRMMTSEMWVVSTTNSGWAEVGLMQGYRGGAVGYYVFRGWANSSGAYTELTLNSVTQNSGTTDEYQILITGTSGVWRIWWNGPSVDTGNTGFSSTTRIEMGGEVASPEATAGTFNMYGKGLNSSGNQVNFTNQTQSVTSGMTGLSNATGHWRWSIP